MLGFRLDANENIATGHMMRCLTIAKKCRELGFDSIFLLAEDKNTDILDNAGFKYHILNSDWRDWNLGINNVKDCIKRYNIECLVVDSYQVTETFFESLYGYVKLFYLDDLCVNTYSVNAVLRYTQWDDEHMLQDLYHGLKTSVYSGFKYVPLRDEFTDVTIDNDLKMQIMITTGGTDPFHMTAIITKALLKDPFFEKYHICAVLGKMNCDKQLMNEMTEKNNRLIVYQNVSNISELMKRSCVAVSAGGSTVYEYFACGVPVVCFGFSDDQIQFGTRLEIHNNAIWAGDVRLDKEKVAAVIISGLKNYLLSDLNKISMEVQKLVDGNGAMRIAQILTRL